MQGEPSGSTSDAFNSSHPPSPITSRLDAQGLLDWFRQTNGLTEDLIREGKAPADNPDAVQYLPNGEVLCRQHTREDLVRALAYDTYVTSTDFTALEQRHGEIAGKRLKKEEYFPDKPAPGQPTTVHVWLTELRDSFGGAVTGEVYETLRKDKDDVPIPAEQARKLMEQDIAIAQLRFRDAFEGTLRPVMTHTERQQIEEIVAAGESEPDPRLGALFALCCERLFDSPVSNPSLMAFSGSQKPDEQALFLSEFLTYARTVSDEDLPAALRASAAH